MSGGVHNGSGGSSTTASGLRAAWISPLSLPSYSEPDRQPPQQLHAPLQQQLGVKGPGGKARLQVDAAAVTVLLPSPIFAGEESAEETMARDALEAGGFESYQVADVSIATRADTVLWSVKRDAIAAVHLRPPATLELEAETVGCDGREGRTRVLYGAELGSKFSLAAVATALGVQVPYVAAAPSSLAPPPPSGTGTSKWKGKGKGKGQGKGKGKSNANAKGCGRDDDELDEGKAMNLPEPEIALEGGSRRTANAAPFAMPLPPFKIGKRRLVLVAGSALDYCGDVLVNAANGDHGLCSLSGLKSSARKLGLTCCLDTRRGLHRRLRHRRDGESSWRPTASDCTDDTRWLSDWVCEGHCLL
eukprot:SAG31_NODE_5756_length_2342_cov_1.624164_1_plen_361_part_00